MSDHQSVAFHAGYVIGEGLVLFLIAVGLIAVAVTLYRVTRRLFGRKPRV